ncbi:unnamed protein product, partial [Ectocarpus sp. 4 AP-2014]
SANAICEETVTSFITPRMREVQTTRKYVPDDMLDRVCGSHFPGPQEGPLGSAREGMVDVYPALSVMIFVPACRLQDP